MVNHSGESGRDDEGAVSTEYLFLMALIALAIVLGATAFGLALGGTFDDAGQRVTSEVDTTSS